MKIVVFADTHNQHDRLVVPEGDMLICAGDFCGWGTEKECLYFSQWFKNQPHKYKILIAGNHDKFIDTVYGYGVFKEMLGPEIIYLEDQGVEIEGLVIWGSPYTPEFGRDWAFNAVRGEHIKRHWDKIPEDVDILITHGPPRGIQDITYGYVAGDSPEIIHVGCEDLRNRLPELRNLKLHVFGHIHAGYGVYQENENSPVFINAAVSDTTREGYNVSRDPYVVTIETPEVEEAISEEL